MNAPPFDQRQPAAVRARTAAPRPRRRWPSAVWCAVVHVFISGLFLYTGPPPLWLTEAGSWLALGCCALVLVHRWFLYPTLPLLILAAAGLACQRSPQPQSLVLLDARPISLSARLREWHVEEEQTWGLLDQMQDVHGDALAPSSSVLLVVTESLVPAPQIGDRLELEGRLSHNGRSFRLEAFRWRLLHDGRAPPGLVLRNAVRHRLQKALSPEEAGLAIALLLGERREVMPNLQDTYRRFGLVHLLAVSGMHFWLWDQLLRRLLRGPCAYLRLPILGLAAIMAGGTAPVMRAFWAVLLRDLAARFLRPVRGMHLWAAAWTLELCLCSPQSLHLGFVLSYAATGFLILGALEKGKPLWRKTLQASWVAFLGSMPFLHAVQGTVEPWSIVLSPILGVLLPFRLCGAFLALIPGLGSTMDGFLHGISWVETQAFALLESAPWSPWLTTHISTAWFAIAAVAGFFATYPKLPQRFHLRKLMGVVFLLCLCGPTPHHAGLSVLPVGHGLAAVIAGEERSLSFDLGSGERAPRDLVERLLFPELLKRHWKVPDRIVLSHGDRDHVNGVPFLQRRLNVEEIQVAPMESYLLEGMEPWQVTVYGCQGALLQVSNDAGHILDIRLDDFRAVLLGDQSGSALHNLMQQLPPGPIDLLLVPHHGLTTDGFAGLLEHLKPERAWSSSGPKNFPLPVAPLLEHFEVPLETTLFRALHWAEDSP